MGAQWGDNLNRSKYLKYIQEALALLAIVFGALTLFAGFRVLTGTNPGYVVFRPLLIYNTVMGFVYIGVGIVSWRNLNLGKQGAAAILLLNLIVLLAIIMAYVQGEAVAIDSLRAMTLRTGVWLALFSGLWWLNRRNTNTTRQA